jgi:hypothetical protein
MPRAKEIFPLAVLSRRAIASSALVYSNMIINQLLNLLLNALFSRISC